MSSGCGGASVDGYRANGFWFIGFAKWRRRTVLVRRRVDGNGTRRWDRKWRPRFKPTYRRCRPGTHAVIGMSNKERATQVLTYGWCRIEVLERNWI